MPASRQLAFIKLALGAARADRSPQAILCMHVNLGAVAWMMRGLTSAPIAMAVYGVDVWGDLPRWDAAALRRADRVWSISAFTSAQVVSRHRVEAEAIRPWPLGLSAIPMNHERRESTVPTVVTVARLTKRNAYKGVDTLILAWPHVLRQIPAARLNIVGDGDHMEALGRLSVLLGVSDSVHFLGRLNDEARDVAYAEADVFALPGRVTLGRDADGEGFGLVFLEAQASGLPVVAGDAGGAPEALLPDRTGFLTDPEDPLDVARRLVRLLQNRALSAKMGEAGRRWVLAEKNPEQARNAMSALVDDLLER